MQGGTQEHSDE